MDFALSEEQRMLVETLRTFIATELAPLEAEIEATGVLRPELARTVHEKAKALGLYAMNIPAELGGGDGVLLYDAPRRRRRWQWRLRELLRRRRHHRHHRRHRRRHRRRRQDPGFAAGFRAARPSGFS